MKFEFTKQEQEYLIEQCNFTEQEEQIFNYRIKGKSIVEISMLMYISEMTVKRRIKSIKGKIHKIL